MNCRTAQRVLLLLLCLLTLSLAGISSARAEDVTEPPGEVTEAPEEPTQAPEEPTQAPEPVTEAPVIIKAPVMKSISVEKSGLKVRWTAMGSVQASFKVYRSTDKKSWKYLGVTDKLWYLDKTAVCGVRNYYKVTGIVSGRKYACPAPRSIVYKIPAPALSKPKVTGTSIQLSWSSVKHQPAHRYVVYRRTGTGSWVKKTVTGTCSFTDTDVVSGKRYTYRVACVSKDGKTKYSAVSSPDRTVLYLRTPRIRTGSTTKTGLYLSWGAVDGAYKYEVYRKDGNNWVRIATTSSTSFTDKKAKQGNGYRYSMRAVSKDGKSFSARSSAQLIKCNPINAKKTVRLLIVNTIGGHDAIKRKLQYQGAVVDVAKTKNYDVSKYDGLVLPGRYPDVDPSFYGEKRNGANAGNIELDRLQIDAVKRFVKAKKPILGICGGEEIINVALGGSLIQNIGKSGYHWGGKTHTDTISKGSRLYSLYGKTLKVACYHHQAVKKLAPNLIKTAESDDGVLEAYEHAFLNIYGYQFHPESGKMDGTPIFRDFVNVCKQNVTS